MRPGTRRIKIVKRGRHPSTNTQLQGLASPWQMTSLLPFNSQSIVASCKERSNRAAAEICPFPTLIISEFLFYLTLRVFARAIWESLSASTCYYLSPDPHIDDSS
jgi:hypothetical protein